MSNPNLQTTDEMVNLKIIEVAETEKIQDGHHILLGSKFDLFTFLGLVIGRSLFPVTAVVIIGGTILWGPWISLVLAFSWFAIVLMWIG
jgi:LytS/YehU family sensor histidine kinase